MKFNERPRNATGQSVRRGYVDIPEGQIHYRAAGAEAAGVAPLICFHESPYSSVSYQEILPSLGRGRRAVAIDTPGFGESFRPQSKPSLPDYADWLMEAVMAMGFATFDVMGLFTGAGIAADMARRWPDQVRRVVLLAPPFFTEAHPNRKPWPLRPEEDGSHLMFEWQRTMIKSRTQAIPFERRWQTYRELWRGGGDAIWGEEAVSAYPLRDTLPEVRQSTLVVHPDSVLADVEGAANALPHVQVARLEGVNGYTMLQLNAEPLAAIVNQFLD